MPEIKRISMGDKEILLIPTAHVSQESVALVEKTLEEEKPDAICIELDPHRYERIKNPSAWEEMNVVDIIKKKQTGLMIANLFLSSYQRNIAKKLGTMPGGEMMAGIKASEETGARLVLGDRNIQTTFLRIWRSLSAGEKFKLFWTFLKESDEEVEEEDLQALMGEDQLEEAIAGLGENFPQIRNILVHERDQYLADHIKKAPGKKVAAILGAAHVPGVERELWIDTDIQKLDTIPAPSPWGKILPWVIPLVMIAVILYGFVQNGSGGWEAVKSWVFWNALFGGLFTLLALGHPLSILTAIIAAPITSINPFLACGWFAGLTEATVRKPRMIDVENIPEDIFSLKGILHNRFLRALFIVIFANIGSTIGTVVAGLDIVNRLF